MISSFLTALFIIAYGNAKLQFNGKCLDGDKVAVKDYDLEKAAGQWYEAYRDKYAEFEFDGKCNKNFLTVLSEESSAHSGSNFTFDEGFFPIMKIQNS